MQAEPDLESRCLAALCVAEAHILDPHTCHRKGAPTSLDLFALACPKDREHRVTYEVEDLATLLVDLLDGLDPTASYAPTLAAFHFSQTPAEEDLRSIIGYLSRIGSRDPTRNWRWLAHAVYLARHRLGDLSLALEVAQRLEHFLTVWNREGFPSWR